MLEFYIIETAFVWIEGIVHQILLDRKLKKEGYKFIKKNYFSLFDIVLLLIIMILHSIPVFNLIFPISHLNFHRAYDEHKNYLLEAGSIEEPDIEIEKNKSEIKSIAKQVVKKIESTSPKEIYQPLNRDDSNTEEVSKTYSKKIKSNY